MAKLPHYALDFDAIEPTIEEFFSGKAGYVHNFIKEDEYTYKVEVSDGKCKKPGLVIIHNKQGLYCLDVGGTPSLSPLCRTCIDFILERLKLPSVERQSVSFKGVDADIVEICLQYLGDNYVLSEDKKDVPDARHFIVSDAYRSAVSVICYENGTLLVQGAFTALFLRVLAEITKGTEAAPDVAVQELLRIAPLTQNRYEVEINKLVTKPRPLIDKHLDVMVLSSAVLANSAIALGDYGAYPFGILKAIEGLLSIKLQAHLNSDFESFGGCFQPDASNIQRLSVPDFNAPAQSALKTAIEDSYNFYNNNRHSTFHTKKLTVEASRILTYEDAIDMIDDGLILINRLCDNW